MAGMEELEIHSKSYLVRWINVKGDHTISWSIQPHKKSLNFGIFKHPGKLTSSAASAAASHASDSHSIESSEHPQPSAVIDKLRAIGLKPIQWIGKCEADKISQGTYDVPAHEGGNYALVFDNTFSKQTSKTATLVLLTYPTAMPPQSGHQVHHSQAMAAANNAGGAGHRVSPKLDPVANGSSESLRQVQTKGRTVSGGKPTNRPGSATSSNGLSTTVHTGVLQKRRRKRHQGWARRFFSLDFTSSTLSYYHDRNSSALRGAIPLQLAAVACNAERREISIDSGAEIWHLRASNDQDFAAWKTALEKASKQTKEERPSDTTSPLLQIPSQSQQRLTPNPAEDREWEQIESLVSKVSGTRDAIRRLAKDTDPKYFSTTTLAAAPERRGRSPSPQPSPLEHPGAGEDYFDSTNKERRPFWKRKPSSNTTTTTTTTATPTPTLKRAATAAPLSVPTPSSDTASVLGERKPRSVISHPDHEDDIHEHLMAVLRDLDTVVAEFSALIAESKHRRHPPLSAAPSRRSMESDISQEFFDAEDGAGSPLLQIQHDSEEEEEEEAEKRDEEELVEDEADSLSGSDVDDEGNFTRKGLRLDNSSLLFPSKPKSMIPLPLNSVQRRNIVPAPVMQPPSLIGFLRKNVGKDLSAISMPVTANEPLSLLQRAAECMEYSTLLDQAASATDGLERLVYVTAFALSNLSTNRVKERAIRKPFNPMLGETFELVREDRGFRLIAEKVSHRPVQLAYQADSKDWSLAQSPMPTQKFWGKSAEIVTEGKVRLTLHASGERYSWSHATSFLRNIIAGEKYVEPVGEMVVLNETTGQKSVSTFKTGGMFSGRSEEVSVKAFDIHGNELPLGLAGTWTNSLQLTEHGTMTNKTIWSAGSLVDQAAKRYGFPVFAATLNEVTPIEQGKLPPTDSRLRPDQRALEEGNPDLAEELKAKLEEKQRERRREMEAKGATWRPRWFTRVSETDGEEVIWRLKTGKDGYWEERGRGEWNGVVPIFKL
ncbi:hypothetical protein VTN77DRAFT_9226 [Rasamsonia byssochlamydoides]|uniref:uncharacterized protein n=1 Tax=Rasamsonia byssochlamydoides TaxID=89139 RepID=UPI0037445B16